jgi:hypothetical protein
MAQKLLTAEDYLAPLDPVLTTAVSRVLEERPADPVAAIGRLLCQASGNNEDDEELTRGDWATNRANCARAPMRARCAVAPAADIPPRVCFAR